MKTANLVGCVFRALLTCMLIGLFSAFAHANNIRIIGKPVIPEDDKDTINNTVLIKFDLAWDNSWKTSKPDNHDAAWIFVKCWDGERWNHVYLEGPEECVPGSKVPADAVNTGVIYSVTDRKGENTMMDMVLEPGYSEAWKEWRLDPEEESTKCVVGYFLHRKDFGAGHVVVPGITFKWNYGSQGFVDEDDLVVKVFAVEMVYVPKGDFYLGGVGSTDNNRHYAAFTTNGTTFGTPMLIKSEDAITVSNSTDANTLWTWNGLGIEEGVIPKDFPKGHQAFYIMKYEMTQEAYVDFLNTLSQGQQDGRVTGTLSTFAVNAWIFRDVDGAGNSHYKNSVKIKTPSPVVVFGCDGNNNGIFNEVDTIEYDYRGLMQRNIDGQDIAMNYINVLDWLAYAEFSGLRPMTELEFEKACRGTMKPANDEFAWGSVTMMYLLGWGEALDIWYGTERANGSYNSGAGGYTWWGWWGGLGQGYYVGPIRVGCFADSTTTRQSSGASYWGVMNLSDNVGEICISAYDTTGRNFVGSHGCGQLDQNGDATNPDWLTFAGTASTPANCRYFIVRGMAIWNQTGAGTTIPASEWQWAGLVSNRRTSVHTLSLIERQYHGNGTVGMRGIRCVRTADAER